MTVKKLIIVAGPTAVGKTAMSIELAQHYNCPIISFDSRQFYREMSIGTAKPTPEELSQAEHHFIGNLSIHDHYTAGIYEREALEKLDSIFRTNDYCIAVGGSGLYIDALAFGIDDIPSDPEVRAKFIARWETEGLEVLQKEVLAVDPDFYHASDMQNSRRVIRALEVYAITGKPYTELRKKQPKQRPFEMYWVGLNLEREVLFDRINRRVDIMLEMGLETEVKSLYEHKEVKALNTVGYRELFSSMNGEYSREKAVELIKRNTRYYAKRQITWFKKNELVNWYMPHETPKIIEEIGK
ncbi:MAG: tRNA (adenosine(37)-N6)-dimethylallyltransferase MiaA [Crocinitomix sp.]|nr:tRNA (adenosine(37)-N6)-dimethylallyltransferase MiaA [Crocinitomix sp.]